MKEEVNILFHLSTLVDWIIGRDQSLVLPATTLSPSNVRTFHEKSESKGQIRDTPALLFDTSIKVSEET